MILSYFSRKIRAYMSPANDKYGKSRRINMLIRKLPLDSPILIVDPEHLSDGAENYLAMK